MKKYLAAVLACILCVSACACAPREQAPEEVSFVATVLEIKGDIVLVEPEIGRAHV